MEKTILCYGDSNTWGFVPISPSSYDQLERYQKDDRWTGIIQKHFERIYNVIEEGLNGRTTNIDYHVPPNRNGKTYLPPCLYSHAPIELVILALGGNDFKHCFSRSPMDIKNGISDLIELILDSKYGQEFKSPPQILVIPPPIPLLIAEEHIDDTGMKVFSGAIKKAEILYDLCKTLSDNRTVYVLEESVLVKPSTIDGLHYDKSGHKKLAKYIINKLEDIFI